MGKMEYKAKWNTHFGRTVINIILREKRAQHVPLGI
jgi:hypothetical protein